MPETAVVADVLADLRTNFSDQTYYDPNQRDEAITAAIASLKDAPSEAPVEFVLTGLRIVREGPGSWFVHALIMRLGKCFDVNSLSPRTSLWRSSDWFPCPIANSPSRVF